MVPCEFKEEVKKLGFLDALDENSHIHGSGVAKQKGK